MRLVPPNPLGRRFPKDVLSCIERELCRALHKHAAFSSDTVFKTAVIILIISDVHAT